LQKLNYNNHIKSSCIDNHSIMFSEANLYENVRFLEKLPIIQTLTKENKKLQKKNKELKKLVKLITRNLNLMQQPAVEQCSQTIPELHVEGVKIKIEPGMKDCKMDKANIEKTTIVINDDLESDTNSEILKANGVFTEKKYNDKVVNNKMYEKNPKCEEIVLDDEDDEEDEYEVSDDEQELDYGELAQEKGEMEEWLEERKKERKKEEEVVFKLGYTVEEDDEEDDEEEEEEEESSVEEGANGGNSPVEESPVEEEEDVFEIELNGKTYYTSDTVNGVIYDVDDEGEISVEVGKFKNNKATFYKNKK